MQYRRLGRTGLNVSEIGMGTEHLLDKDEQTVIATIKAAVEGGVNYFDCHVGHDFPEESVSYDGYDKLGKALAGLRDKLYISYITFYKDRSFEFTQPRFDYFLNALNTDHTDVFMIQFCDKENDYESILSENGALDHVKKLRLEGKVRFIGISTHSTEIAHKAIKSGEFDVIMFPVNPAFDVLTDEEQYKTDNLETLWDAAHDFNADKADETRPRKSVYNECEKNDIGLVAMKPFAGGFIFRVEGEAGFTPVNLISYALTQNGVATVVPGCTKPDEINEILTYKTAGDDVRDYSGAVAKSRWSVAGSCIYCNHCLPCEAGISVGVINKFIDSVDYNPDTDIGEIHSGYDKLPVKASACVECGICEERCPFDVKIISRMKRAAELFD